MCRLLAVRASEPVSARGPLADESNSLLAQSLGDASGMVHGDGWGIGFYQASHREPGVIRSARSAAVDADFLHTAGHVRSHALLAHVRRASHGARRWENSHPFRHGPWLFAHNGSVSGFLRVQRRLAEETAPDLLASREGQTDSELVFLWLLSRLRAAGVPTSGGSATGEVLAAVVRQATVELALWCRAAAGAAEEAFNFLLTDGSVLLASRWNRSLYWTQRDEPVNAHLAASVVVASEPIGRGRWKEIAEQGILTVDASMAPRLHAFCG